MRGAEKRSLEGHKLWAEVGFFGKPPTKPCPQEKPWVEEGPEPYPPHEGLRVSEVRREDINKLQRLLPTTVPGV